MMINKTFMPYIFYSILVAYLLIGTGYVSDDFICLDQAKNKPLSYLLTPSGPFLHVPIERVTQYAWYGIFNPYNTILVDIIKVLYMLLSLFLIAKFFSLYLDKNSSYFAAFLFIFFPSHDSTTYWFLEQSITLSFAFYLYSFYKAEKNKLAESFIFALAASFISYGSPAVALALFALFAMKREINKGTIILLPNIFFILYNTSLSIIYRENIVKIGNSINLASFLKQYIFQILTFLDAMAGPSALMKIYYSVQQLTVVSIIACLLISLVIYRYCRGNIYRYNFHLLVSLATMIMLSFMMFALTGRYPQLSFNLGNRTTIFGALLVVYLLMAMPANKLMKNAIYILLIISIFGISDHWKAWSHNQQYIMARIKNNRALQEYSDSRPIYVSGNQYSMYGKISHIDFFSEDVVESVFKIVLGKNILVRPINRRFYYEDGFLVDVKYGETIQVNGYINVYDSISDSLFMVKAEDINSYIDSLPHDNRNWAQLLNIGAVKRIAVGLMPRLEYAL